MRIAVVGSGISGLVCAYLLAEKHDVILFEKEGRLGGHTCTVPVEHEGRSLAVDTGFIVFNEKNYPGFCRLLARLGVESRPTTMSFSVRDESDGFEYGGSSVAGILGSPANLGRRRWWSVVSPWQSRQSASFSPARSESKVNSHSIKPRLETRFMLQPLPKHPELTTRALSIASHFLNS